MKFCLGFMFIFLVMTNSAMADLETLGGDDVDISQFNQETLFISLGSYCAPASLARSCGYRKAAFPFDWNISMDGEKLIEILDDDFSYFLNRNFLVPFGWATLLNTYYHLEFVHDGNWDGNNSWTYMPILQSKYIRRIERFRKLKEHRGKIFFVRAAYIDSMVDLNRYYKLIANIEISEDHAQRLYDALKRYFPKLNFSLIIINNHPQETVEIEKNVNDSILMVRASHDYTIPAMQSAYEDFFQELIKLD